MARKNKEPPPRYIQTRCLKCGHLIIGKVAQAEVRDKLWREYRDLLGEEIDSMMGIAHTHGWASTDERIQRGNELRKALGVEARAT